LRSAARLIPGFDVSSEFWFWHKQHHPGAVSQKEIRVVKGILEKKVWLPYFGAGFCPETERNR